MTIKYKEHLTDNLSIKEMAMYDNKENILQSFRLINVKINKNYKKAELADGLEHIFTHEPALFCNILPREEQKILAELLMYPQDHYVEVPRDYYKYLLMQKLHLVITYEGLKTWHLYMPDSIRQRLNSMFEEDLKLYPEIEEMHNIFEQMTEKRDHLFQLMDKTNPDALSPEQAKKMYAEVDGIARFITDAKPRLKKIEAYLHKNTDTKINQVWMDIKHTEMYIAIMKATLTLRIQS